MPSLEVEANDVRYAVYEVHPERIFAATEDDTPTVFDPIADADLDNDGVVTGAELRAVPLPGAVPETASTEIDGVPEGAGTAIDPSPAPSCSGSSSESRSFACVTLLDRIADNAQHVLVPVAATH